MNTLQQLLERYAPTFPKEAIFKDNFFELLRHPRAFFRDHLPGHITGSAWVVNPQRTHCLLLHHQKLDKWLQPGGHADGCLDVATVACKELNEETKLGEYHLVEHAIFDLDIHTIPPRVDFPQHLHYDVRFLVEAPLHASIQGNHESKKVQWVPFNELEKFTVNESILRMRQKTQLLAIS